MVSYSSCAPQHWYNEAVKADTNPARTQEPRPTAIVSAGRKHVFTLIKCWTLGSSLPRIGCRRLLWKFFLEKNLLIVALECFWNSQQTRSLKQIVTSATFVKILLCNTAVNKGCKHWYKLQEAQNPTGANAWAQPVPLVVHHYWLFTMWHSNVYPKIKYWCSEKSPYHLFSKIMVLSGWFN